jgi:hypothetical protein
MNLVAAAVGDEAVEWAAGWLFGKLLDNARNMELRQAVKIL